MDFDYSVNKIYSFTVVQYCKPEDIPLFIDRQLRICQEDREYVILHAEIPDVNKAWYWYKKSLPKLEKQVVEENSDKLRTIYESDGSYWHSMNYIIDEYKKRGIEECYCIDGVSDYRSSILIKFNGKNVKTINV